MIFILIYFLPIPKRWFDTPYLEGLILRHIPRTMLRLDFQQEQDQKIPAMREGSTVPSMDKESILYCGVYQCHTLVI